MKIKCGTRIIKFSKTSNEYFTDIHQSTPFYTKSRILIIKILQIYLSCTSSQRRNTYVGQTLASSYFQGNKQSPTSLYSEMGFRSSQINSPLIFPHLSFISSQDSKNNPRKYKIARPNWIRFVKRVPQANEDQVFYAQ